VSTLPVRGIYDDGARGKGNDGVCKVISCEKPADDSNGLLIASIALAVDQDDAVHVIIDLLKCCKKYVCPGLA